MGNALHKASRDSEDQGTDTRYYHTRPFSTDPSHDYKTVLASPFKRDKSPERPSLPRWPSSEGSTSQNSYLSEPVSDGATRRVTEPTLGAPDANDQLRMSRSSNDLYSLKEKGSTTSSGKHSRKGSRWKFRAGWLSPSSIRSTVSSPTSPPASLLYQETHRSPSSPVSPDRSESSGGGTYFKSDANKDHPSDQMDTLTTAYLSVVNSRLQQKQQRESQDMHHLLPVQSALPLSPRSSHKSHKSVSSDQSYAPPPLHPPQHEGERLIQELYSSPDFEQERKRDMDIAQRTHYLIKHIWGRNHRMRLKDPSLIVHWWCSTGHWCYEMATEYPDAKVVGIDYGTVRNSTGRPPNLELRKVAIHDGCTGLEAFEDNSVDCVMLRSVWCVNAPDHRWHSLLEQVFRILKPGGACEIYEPDLGLSSKGPNMTVLDEWTVHFLESIAVHRDILMHLDDILVDVGFDADTLQTDAMELPVGEWAKSGTLKETGYLIKDYVERRYKQAKQWICHANDISYEVYCDTLTKALNECEPAETHVTWLYYGARKPLVIESSIQDVLEPDNENEPNV
ncbi:hypothetical protein BCR43DRAFT_511626 [Syncephalastrum racemosum]|uniref:Methyltransferase domain-containing protein n=1 Tax=Syncephalastrum racemosum TaxID=13706 RepID=A0A1X2HMS0_SYNRA|nr:hypothetical protein BCR43DRAFT_511626 [Syncephalastrum racemosum]